MKIPRIDDRQKLFSSAVGRYGGSLAPDKAPGVPGDILRLWAEEFCKIECDEANAIERQEFLKSGWIYFGFIDNRAINAVAFTRDNLDFIALFAGVPFMLRDAFLALLSTAWFLPGVGDPSLEVASDTDVGAIVRGPLLRRYATLIPNCQIRKRAADLLAATALRFVFSHELGHHVRGHLRYLQKSTAEATYVEIPYGPLSDADCLVRRSLELDADRQGLNGSFAVHRQLYDEQLVPELSAIHFLGSWLTSILVTFYLLGFRVPRRSKLVSTHPSPGARVLATVFYVERSLLNYEPALIVDWKAQFQAVLEESSATFARLGMPHPFPDGVEAAYQEQAETEARLEVLEQPLAHGVAKRQDLIRKELERTVEGKVFGKRW